MCSQKHPKMARLRQRSCIHAYNDAQVLCRSGAAAGLWGAALPGIGATPGLFGDRPTIEPVGKSGLAIKWSRSRANRLASTAIASFAMVCATPGFLFY